MHCSGRRRRIGLLPPVCAHKSCLICGPSKGGKPASKDPLYGTSLPAVSDATTPRLVYQANKEVPLCWYLYSCRCKNWRRGKSFVTVVPQKIPLQFLWSGKCEQRCRACLVPDKSSETIVVNPEFYGFPVTSVNAYGTIIATSLSSLCAEWRLFSILVFVSQTLRWSNVSPVPGLSNISTMHKGTQLKAPQSPAHRRGAFRDFHPSHPNPIHFTTFEH